MVGQKATHSPNDEPRSDVLKKCPFDIKAGVPRNKETGLKWLTVSGWPYDDKDARGEGAEDGSSDCDCS